MPTVVPRPKSRRSGSVDTGRRPWIGARWRRLLVAGVAAIGLVAAASAADTAYVFRTLAGSAGASGAVDATGAAARFARPQGLAIDAAGNLYVADHDNSAIRRVTPDGVVTTFAGVLGQSGSADGDAATARFNHPWGLAIDAAGNLYVADMWNCAIRKISPAGEVTTLAGRPGQAGGDDGTGADARFRYPRSVAVDAAGNVYVADTDNHAIRRIAAAGEVTTLAGLAGTAGSADGTGSAARFNYPAGIVVDAGGALFVADEQNHTIRRVTSAGVVTTYAGQAGVSGIVDGPRASARLSYPGGLAAGPAGDLFAVSGDSLVRRISASGAVSTLAGAGWAADSTEGAGTAARFNAPHGIAVDASGGLLVADTGNHTVRAGRPVSRPEIVTPPAAVTSIVAGEALRLSATLASDAGATFQWYRNGVPLAGETAATLTRAAVSRADAGSYTVVAANEAGTAKSGVALVIVGTSAQPGIRAKVDPLLGVEYPVFVWPLNQQYPVTASTDSEAIGGRVGNACGPTGVANLLRYWEFPRRGAGTRTFTDHLGCTWSFDFGGTELRYDLMPASVTTNSPAAQIDAVATLMYAAGVAAHNPDRSGYGGDVVAGLQAYLCYSRYAQLALRSDYTDAQWRALYQSELSAGRPILMAGNAPAGGGHWFICDGYREDGKFHIRWDYGEAADQWLALDGFAPYTEAQAAIIGLEPDRGGKELRLTAPSAGDAIKSGTAIAIAWTSSGVDRVRLEYSTDGGATWRTIATVATAPGSYVWTPPTGALPGCKVRVVDAADDNVYARTGGTFSIYTVTAPTIAKVADQVVAKNGATATLAFKVGDAETPAANLVVTQASSNTSLIPTAAIVLGGTGANRTVKITPAAGKTGTAAITLTVSDGGLKTSTTFKVSVLAPPTVATQPQSRAVKAGVATTLATTVGGTGTLTYRWQRLANDAAWWKVLAAASSYPWAGEIYENKRPWAALADGAVYAGAGTAKLTVKSATAAMAGDQFRCVATDAAGSSVITDTVTLSVLAAAAPGKSAGPLIKTTWNNYQWPINAFYPKDPKTGERIGNACGPSSVTRILRYWEFPLRGLGKVSFTADNGAKWSADFAGTTYLYDRMPYDLPTTASESAYGPTATLSYHAAAAMEDRSGSGQNVVWLRRMFVNYFGYAPQAYEASRWQYSRAEWIALLKNELDRGRPILVMARTAASPAPWQPGSFDGHWFVIDGYDSADKFHYAYGYAIPYAAYCDVDQIGNYNSYHRVLIGLEPDFHGKTLALTAPAPGAAFKRGAKTTVTWQSTGIAKVKLEYTTDAGVTWQSLATVAASAKTYAWTLPAVSSKTCKVRISDSADGNVYRKTAGTFSILPALTAPTISKIADQTVNEDQATAAVKFTVGDAETAAALLTVTAKSSDPKLLPAAAIALGGSGGNRTVKLTPAADQNGTATVTLTVNDGTQTAATSFKLTVKAVNDRPTITAIADQKVAQNGATSALKFTIGDAETAASKLQLTKASSSTSLVPLTGIALGGSGANRTVKITPTKNKTGSAKITLTVGDGALSASTSFTVTVAATTAKTIAAFAAVETPAIAETNRVVLAGSRVVLTAPSADESSACRWSKDGRPLAGGTAGALVVPAATLADAGLYRATSIAADGGAVSADTRLTVIGLEARSVRIGSTLSVVRSLAVAGQADVVTVAVPLPAGWRYVGGGAAGAGSAPAIGEDQLLDWSWIAPTAEPQSFTYVLSWPAGAPLPLALEALIEVRGPGGATRLLESMPVR